MQIGGSNRIYKILFHQDLFDALSAEVCNGLLDIMYLLFRHGTYDVARFRCVGELKYGTNGGLVNILLSLLKKMISHGNIPTAKRLIRLIGVTCTAGVSAEDLKEFLTLLRTPSELSKCLLQALKTMIKQDDGVVKASPTSFFNFGGIRSGLYVQKMQQFPLSREYQIAMWIRIDSFLGKSSNDQHGLKQHLITCTNAASQGLDVFIDNQHLCISTSDSRDDAGVIRIENFTFRRGIWYHFCIRHTKPRISLFARDEMIVTIDHEVVLQQMVRYPFGPKSGDVTEFCCGKNFDGQIGPIYIFAECLPSAAVEVIARLNAGKVADGHAASSSIDLMQSVTASDRKIMPFSPKMHTVFHPCRCAFDQAIDVHGGRHARFGARTHPWNAVNARDVLASLGGIGCLLPLFPRLLIEHDYFISGKNSSSPATNSMATGARHSSQSSYMSTVETLPDANADLLCSDVLSPASALQLEESLDSTASSGSSGEGIIALLLSLIARCIRSHRTNQKELLRCGGVDMIEYALCCTPGDILRLEGESCVLALLQLRAATRDCPPLENLISKNLLCNFRIWSRCCYQLQSSLMSVILAAARAQPEYFSNIIGVSYLLDFVCDCYTDNNFTPEPKGTIQLCSIPEESPPSQVNSPVDRVSSGSSSDLEGLALVGTSSSVVGLDVAKRSSFIDTLRRQMSIQTIDRDISIGESPASEVPPEHASSAGDPEIKDSDDGVDTDASDSKSVTLRPSLAGGTEPSEIPLEISTCRTYSDVSSQICCLNAEEKKNIRSNLLAVLSVLVQHGMSAKEVCPLVEFLATHSDNTVMNEVAQVLLFLIVECGARFLSIVTECCQGPEEFAAFVLCTLIKRPDDELRCTGVRLLTHYCSRSDSLTSSVLNLSLKRKKGGVLSRVRDRFSTLSAGQGIERLDACGGISLLSIYLLQNKELSTESTYLAILEMLLTTSASMTSSGAAQFRGGLYEDNATGISHGATHNQGLLAMRQLTYMPNYASPKCMDDEVQEMTNPAVLTVFFDVLPTLPIHALDRVYGDLLALLKHSEGNRDAFCRHPAWHLCLSSLTSQLIQVNELCSGVLHSSDICNLLEKHAVALSSEARGVGSLESVWHPPRSRSVSPATTQKKSRKNSAGSREIRHSYTTAESPSQTLVANEGRLLRSWSTGGSPARQPASAAMKRDNLPKFFDNPAAARTAAITSLGNPLTDQMTINLWYDIGMKIYATLLMHALDLRNGWRELEKTYSLSYQTITGLSVVKAAFSHVFHELTFTLRSRYRDVHRLSKSSNSEETAEATYKLENILMLILSFAIFILDVQSMAVISLPSIALARRRLSVFSDIKSQKESLDASACTYEYLASNNANSNPNVDPACETSEDICAVCGHSMSLHDSKNDILERIVEERLCQLVATEDEARSDDDLFSIVLNSPEGASPEDIPVQELEENTADDDSHFWLQIDPDFVLPTSQADIVRLVQLDPTASSPQSAGSSMNYRTQKEYLQPLKRGTECIRAKLVLILQTLRFFDLLFWPNPSHPLRNVHLLRFQRETALNGFDHNRNPASGGKHAAQQQSQSMSIYSCIIRLCLYVLSVQSPLEETAELNIRRIRQLLLESSRTSPYFTPVDDWVLVSVVHVLVALKRLLYSLRPVFRMLGIPEDLIQYSTSSTRSTFHDDVQMHSKLETIFDNAMDDVVMLTKIDVVLNNLAGRRLLRYIGSAIKLFVDVYETHKRILINAFGEKGFLSLTLLVQRKKNDSLFRVSKVKESMHAATITTADALASCKVSPVDTAPVPQTKPNYKDMLKNLAQSDDDEYEEGSSTSTSNSTTLNAQTLNQKPYSMMDASTASDDEDNDGSNRSRSNSFCSTPAAEEANFGREALDILRWLCDPFLKFDPLKHEGILQSIFALENLELEYSKSFFNELGLLKKQLESLNSMESKLTGEVAELQELGRSVQLMLADKRQIRKFATDAEDDTKIKCSAGYWQRCLRKYDDDWSPWFCTEAEADSRSLGNDECPPLKVAYKLSEHRDSLMRRMLLVRMSDGVRNYENAAYSKTKSREDREDGGADEPCNEPVISPSSPFWKDTLKFIRPKPAAQFQAVGSVPASASDVFSDQGGIDQSVSKADSSSSIKVMSLFSTSNEKRPLWTTAFQWANDEKEIQRWNVSQIDLEKVLLGCLLLTNKCVYFHPKKWTGGLAGKDATLKDRRWRLDRLVEAYRRRYLLQNRAIELFFADTHEVFFAFSSSEDLNRFFSYLLKLPTPLLITPSSLNPKEVFAQSNWTELWRRRIISNFEYLMRLNLIAGRSYNDITQYPVFPWVLSDYKSKILDLTDPKSYRDLSKPVGALRQERLEEFMERYRAFEDPEIPKFMYGSHYSSAGVVLQYLIRQEPYTSLSVSLQGGKFDVPDRLFFDIESTWEGCNKAMSDVKELIPEMFGCPEILLNTNNLPLGELQDKKGRVDDVRLPPWAKDAFDFIRIHREALESEYTSANLHSWIDLIFGYRQTGAAAVEAHNVFYYLTYENSVDISTIEDPLQREAAKAQVINFGQTPSQLTLKEHPRRLPKEECMTALCSDISNLSRIKLFTPAKQYGNINNSSGNELGAVLSIKCSADRLVTVHSDLTVCIYRWSSFPEGESIPVQVKAERTRQLPSVMLSTSQDCMKKRGFSTFFRTDNDSVTVSNRTRDASQDYSLADPSGDALESRQSSSSFSTLSPFGEARSRQVSVQNSSEAPLESDRAIVATENPAEERNSLFGRMNIFGALKKRFPFSKADSSGTVVATLTPNASKQYSNNSDDEQEQEQESEMESPMASRSPLSNADPSQGADVGQGFQASTSSEFEEFATGDFNVSGADEIRGNEGISKWMNGFGTSRLQMSASSVALKLTNDLNLGRILTCGYWDQNVKAHSLDSLKEVVSFNGGHIGEITCLELGADGHMLVTGGEDCTCRVWVLENSSIAAALAEDLHTTTFATEDETDADPALVCINVLCGHDTPVCALSYSHNHDLLLSGSQSGLLCLHTVRKGRFIRTIRSLHGVSANVVLLTSPGYLVAHSWMDLSLHLFWLNGQQLGNVKSEDRWV